LATGPWKAGQSYMKKLSEAVAPVSLENQRRYDNVHTFTKATTSFIRAEARRGSAEPARPGHIDLRDPRRRNTETPANISAPRTSTRWCPMLPGAEAKPTPRTASTARPATSRILPNYHVGPARGGGGPNYNQL
jgi:hypothetical protein